MKKRITAMTLVITLLAALAGCGQSPATWEYPTGEALDTLNDTYRGDELMEKLKVPENIADRATTPELLRIVANHPQLWWNLTGDSDYGAMPFFEYFLKNSRGDELIAKEDFVETALRVYHEAAVSETNTKEIYSQCAFIYAALIYMEAKNFLTAEQKEQYREDYEKLRAKVDVVGMERDELEQVYIYYSAITADGEELLDAIVGEG